MRLRLTILFALLALVSVSARAQWDDLHFADPRLNWRTLQSEHFDIHFAEQYRPHAQIIAGIAERVYVRTTALLDWRPRRRTQLVLLDSADFANGFATPVPFNLSGIFLSPPDSGELLQNRDWIELVLSHEFFHIVHLDKASGSPLGARDVLGRLLPFFPNSLGPTWTIEGLAVYHESDSTHRYGRLGQSYFEGMMGAEVDRGLRSLREVNAEGRAFPLNRDYLYGSYFFLFLAERYGARAVRAYIDSYSNNLVPFKVQSNAIATTGKGMDVLWVEYHDWLRQRIGAQAGSFASGDVLLRAWSISSPVLTAAGTRWYVEGNGYTRPRIMRQARGEPARPIRETEDGTRLTADMDEGVLASEQEICSNYNLLYDLHRIDASGRRRPVTRCERDRFAAALGNGGVATVRVEGGAARVVVLEGGAERVLYRARPGESLSGVASSGDRVVVTSLWQDTWALLDVSDGTPAVLVADAAVKHSPRFGISADEIFFVADYGNRYDVWSWRRGNTALARWTRSAFGVREISAPVAGEMLLTTIEADGGALRSYRLPPTPLEERAPATGTPPLASSSEPLALPDRPYSAWQTLRPTAWVPLIQIGDGAIALGAAIYGTDALEVHQYFLAPLVEVTQGELLGQAQYLYDGRHGLLANRTLTVRATEPDGSRPKITAYSTKEDAQWTSLWRSLRLNQRWYWGLGAAIAEERFHNVGDGTALVQNERVVGLLAGVDSRRSQWLSEGPSQGQELRLFLETSRNLGAAFTGNVYRADWRGHLPLGRTVLALRWNEAYGQTGAEPFELGGSKSDEVILLPVLNERDFALRGYSTGTPSLMGHRARVTTVEWRTPLRDIDRHVMVPPVGINRLALNVFMDVGAAWEHGQTPDYHRGIGLEIMNEPRFGYLFGFELRAGFAKGLDETGSTKIYLRAGRSF